ncbi:MAG: NUDIX hydrolase [Pelagimonas sp.]|uniref:NUDIX hydrolase n=1 Tax=Pelagimonas sp. TaxID=2073170 RepID=UPI003D6A3885
MAIGIFRREDYVLAGPVYDDDAQIKGWRPLGGEIEFGERGADALIREMREETNQEVTDVRIIGTLENLYEHHGEKGHEMVLVYEARFANPSIYDADQLAFAEADGLEMQAKWISLPKARAGRIALYPDGLADLL